MKLFDPNEFYRRATACLFSDLQVGQALENILSYLREFIPVDALSLSSADEKNNCLINHVTSVGNSRSPAAEKKYFKTSIHECRSKDLENPEKISVVNDVEHLSEEHRRHLSCFMTPNTSLLRMSIVWMKEHLGSLMIFANGKNRYTQQHIRKIEMLSEPFTMAFATILHYKEVLSLKHQLEDENTLLKSELLKEQNQHIIGADFGLKDVMRKVLQVAQTDSTVLILGETGVGKELVANAVHRQSPRKETPFIKLNCGAIPDSLIDSELFGHEKGAFTGALQCKEGRFERAHTGTLFLDEIGELPLSAQARLLRVLQNREFERVGGTKTITVDVRVIAATNRDLRDMVQRGKFREDLYYRLNVVPIAVPPLKERIGDLPKLIEFISSKKASELKIQREFRPTSSELAEMKQYHWPGNVRELENYIERKLITGTSVELHPIRTESDGENALLPSNESLELDSVVTNHIKRVLDMTKGRIEGEWGAAKLLNLNPSTLRGKMRKYKIRFV